MRILITGITGQDGHYLAELLHRQGDQVFGLVRGQDNCNEARIGSHVQVIYGDLLDGGSLVAAMKQCEPHAVINLAGVTSPMFAWTQQELTSNINSLGVVRLLEAVRAVVPRASFIQAGSVATFGPYGASKEFARIAVADARARGMDATTLVMVGHHSPRRSVRFFSQKVVQAAVRIAAGSRETLHLGPLDRMQDWGFADNFAQAMVAALHADAGEYVLATNDPHSLRDWVDVAFSCLGMDWREHVECDLQVQPYDVGALTGVPTHELDWVPNRSFIGLVQWMVDSAKGE